MAPNKRHYEHNIDLETIPHYDLPEFKEYAELVDKHLTDNVSVFPDGRVKGTTVPELHRLLGEFAIPTWTFDVLGWLDHVLQDGVPVRYRIEVRDVKVILPSVFSLRRPKKEVKNGRHNLSTSGSTI